MARIRPSRQITAMRSIFCLAKSARSVPHETYDYHPSDSPISPELPAQHPLHNGEFAGLIEHLQFRTAELKLRQRPLFKFAQLFGRYQTIEREERTGRDSAHAIPRPVGRRQNRWRIRPWRARAGTHAPDERSHAMMRLIRHGYASSS